jgi:hypothetical protein
MACTGEALSGVARTGAAHSTLMRSIETTRISRLE